MKTLNQLIMLTAALLVLGIGHGNAEAQDFPNFDPQQMEQMRDRMQRNMMDSIRDQLSVTNDTEWSVIEPLITKVMTNQMQSALGGMGMMRTAMGNRGGNFPGTIGLQPDPAAEALQRAVEAKAPTAQIKDLLAKYRESRKRRADQLAKHREELRQVLALRQEAILVSMGILD